MSPRGRREDSSPRRDRVRSASPGGRGGERYFVPYSFRIMRDLLIFVDLFLLSHALMIVALWMPPPPLPSVVVNVVALALLMVLRILALTSLLLVFTRVLPKMMLLVSSLSTVRLKSVKLCWTLTPRSLVASGLSSLLHWIKRTARKSVCRVRFLKAELCLLRKRDVVVPGLLLRESTLVHLKEVCVNPLEYIFPHEMKPS